MITARIGVMSCQYNDATSVVFSRHACRAFCEGLARIWIETTNLKIGLLLFCVLLSNVVIGQSGIPAFPGAEGYGAIATGGRGGEVYTVTNTNSSGPGSLREGLLRTGPRIIVFAVSGVIDMDPPLFLQESNSDVTVAGQTSPGGITLIGSNANSTVLSVFQSGFSNAIFRHVRIRASDNNQDACSFNGADTIIWDHCDFSGATDETFSSPGCRRYTIQWCTISNGSSGQRYGSLIAYNPTSYVSLHHNLWAHNAGRSGPQMHWGGESPANGGMIEYYNNICYNYGNGYGALSAIEKNGVLMGTLNINVVGNYFKDGPNTSSDVTGTKTPVVFGGSHANVFWSDNMWNNDGSMVSGRGIVDTRYYGSPTFVDDAHVMSGSITVFDCLSNFVQVLAYVGAFPRDAMNVRTVDDVKNGTGAYGIDDDPFITSGNAPKTDTDLDGMPDEWEIANGLNPALQDHNGTELSYSYTGVVGYTNVEVYINRLSDSLVNGQGINRPPVLAPIGDKNVPAGQALEIRVQASDADGDALQYSATAP